MKNVSVKLFSFSGGIIGDQWREGVLVMKKVSVKLFSFINKNVSVKLFSFFNGGRIGDQNVSAKFYSFFNGGSIGDEERVCQTLQFLQWRHYW